MSFQKQQQVSTDKFGNSYVLKTAYQKVDKRTGESVEVYKTYFEQGGGLFKIEVSPRHKETKNGVPAMWVKITKVKKQQANKW